MIKEKTPLQSRTFMTEMVMPNDTNPLGSLMGGNLMKWMDLAAGICGAKHCENYVVTASVDHVSFSLPLKLGDIITLEAQVTRAFRTSLELYVQVFVINLQGNPKVKSNHAYFTMVALDPETKRPMEVHKLKPETEDEIFLYEGASRRREIRLILSGRIQAEDASEIKAYFKSM